jgi:hypothetical protein
MILRKFQIHLKSPAFQALNDSEMPDTTGHANALLTAQGRTDGSHVLV